MNSVLQALYFCKPFRERVIQYKIAYAQRVASLAVLESGSSGGLASTGLDNSGNGQLTNGSGSSLNGIYNSVTNGGGGGGNGASALTTGGGGTSGTSTPSAAQQVSVLKQEHLLNCLADLFYSIVTMKKKKGIVQPRKFIARLRKDNGRPHN